MKKRNVSFLRKTFEDYIRKNIPEGETVNLLLSGGLDSSVVGFAAHELGHPVKAYTFQLGDNWSFDSKHACATADKMGWEWNLIQVPDDMDTAKKALRVLAKKFACRRKRDFETGYPALFAYRHIAKHSDSKYVLHGLCADTYFVLSRRANIEGIAGKNSDYDKYLAYRKMMFDPLHKHGHAALNEKYSPSAMYQHLLLSRHYGLQMLCPFEDKRCGDFFFPYTWLELNQPRQKHHLAELYPKYTKLCGHRNHRNYQIEAGIPEFMQKLVNDPEWNKHGYKSASGIYNSLVRGEI